MQEILKSSPYRHLNHNPENEINIVKKQNRYSSYFPRLELLKRNLSSHLNENFGFQYKHENNFKPSFDKYQNLSDFLIYSPNSEKKSFLNKSDLDNFAREYEEEYLKGLKEFAFKNLKLKVKTQNVIENSSQQNQYISNEGLKDVDIDRMNKMDNKNPINLKKSNANIGKDTTGQNIRNNDLKSSKKADKLENILIKTSEVTKVIDDEIEEELNNEILSYTRNMKKYANNFNEVLNKDNRTLNKIESTQSDGKKKTDVQLNKLKDFNYSLTIGFFKLLFMFIFVFISFVISLFMIRFFPKLA